MDIAKGLNSPISFTILHLPKKTLPQGQLQALLLLL